MTDLPHDTGEEHPCVECGQATTRYDLERSGDDWIATYYCGAHAALRRRNRRESQIRALSHDLTWTPEEFMGREGHTLALGGVFADTVDDPDSPPELATWCARVLEICRDLPLREALQRQYLTPDELSAAEHYWDDY